MAWHDGEFNVGEWGCFGLASAIAIIVTVAVASEALSAVALSSLPQSGLAPSGTVASGSGMVAAGSGMIVAAVRFSYHRLPQQARPRSRFLRWKRQRKTTSDCNTEHVWWF